MRDKVEATFLTQALDSAKKANFDRERAKNEATPEGQLEVDNDGLSDARVFVEKLILGLEKRNNIVPEQSESGRKSRIIALGRRKLISSKVKEEMITLWMVASKPVHGHIVSNADRASAWAAFDQLVDLFDPTGSTAFQSKPTSRAPISSIVNSDRIPPEDYVRPENHSNAPRSLPSQPKPNLLSNAIIISTVLGGLLMLISFGKPNPPDPSPEVILGGRAIYTPTGQANVRDKPTTAESNILGQIGPENSFTGIPVQGLDSSTKWVKVSITGRSQPGYVWASRLMDGRPAKHEELEQKLPPNYTASNPQPSLAPQNPMPVIQKSIPEGRKTPRFTEDDSAANERGNLRGTETQSRPNLKLETPIEGQ